MTETPGGSDLVVLLERIGSTLTQSQLDNFAVACARVVRPRLSDARSLRGLDVAERYARGEASRGELDEVAPAAGEVVSGCSRRGEAATAALVGAISSGTETEQLHRAVWEPFAEGLAAGVVSALLSVLREPKPLAATAEPRLPAGASGFGAECVAMVTELTRAATEGRLPPRVAAAGSLALPVAACEAFWAGLSTGFLSPTGDSNTAGDTAFREQLVRACGLLQRAGEAEPSAAPDPAA